MTTTIGVQSAVVIGGAGFLGQHLVQHLLERGCQRIVVFDIRPFPKQSSDYAAASHTDSRVQSIVGDLSQSDEVLVACMRGVDCVFHVASPPYFLQDWQLFERVNVQGTRQVIRACREAGVPKLVLTSSCSVIYNGSDIRNGKETHPYPISYMDYYTETKMLQEKMVLEAADSKLMTVAIRPHGIFGPGDHTVTEMVQKAADGSLKVIIGDGSNLVDFTYVKNVTWGHILAAEQLSTDISGQAFNITNDEPIQFWVFLSTVVQRCGYPSPSLKLPYWLIWFVAHLMLWIAPLVHWLQRGLARSDAQPVKLWQPLLTPFKVALAGTHHYYSCRLAKDKLGYRPLVSVEEGLERTLASLPAHLQRSPLKED